jgi:hypothetical protein
MSFLLELLFVAIVAAVVCYLAYENNVLVHNVTTLAHQAHKEAELAQRRLYLAWKDGYSVPAVPESAKEPETTVPLIPELQELVDDWDLPQAQAAQLAVIRQQLATGKTLKEVYYALMPHDVPESDSDVTIEVGQ